MANRKQQQSDTHPLDDKRMGAAEPTSTAFVEGLASASNPAPEAIAAASSVVADIATGQGDALKNADLIAAFYVGKKLGALELCAHLENNWGAECHVAAADWRKKLEAVQS